jgi:DNA replication protein DnaC
MYHELTVARGDGSYGRQLARLAKTDLLVIDDFALSPLKDQERRDLLEILEDRSERASTLVTSQLSSKNWHEVIGEATLADAICDRLIHGAHQIDLKGTSQREPRAKARRTAKAGA